MGSPHLDHGVGPCPPPPPLFPVTEGPRGRDRQGTVGGRSRSGLTFSLETWWEKGQVPSVFLQVPRRNLCERARGRGRGLSGGRRSDPRPARPGRAHLVHTATFSGSWM